MVGENDVRAIADEQITVHQHAARNELEDELLAVNGNGVPGIVPAGIARHKLEPLGKNVDNLALAFIAPLGANDDRCLTDFQLAAPSTIAPTIHQATAQIRAQLASLFSKYQQNSGRLK